MDADTWGKIVDDAGVELADAVSALRRQLEIAKADLADDDAVRFEVGPVEVEFTVTVTRDAHANGGVRFGVVSFGATGGVSSDRSHRVKLVLTPKDTATGRAPEISAEIDEIPDR